LFGTVLHNVAAPMYSTDQGGAQIPELLGISQHKIINDCTKNGPDQEAKYDDDHRFLDGSPWQRHFQSSSALRITTAAAGFLIFNLFSSCVVL